MCVWHSCACLFFSYFLTIKKHLCFSLCLFIQLIPDPSHLFLNQMWVGGPDNVAFCLRKSCSLDNIFPLSLFSLKRELNTNISICPRIKNWKNPGIWIWSPWTHKNLLYSILQFFRTQATLKLIGKGLQKRPGGVIRAGQED